MLNRLYIVVGVLLILVLIGGFLAPRFYPWSSKRVEIETLAAEALGADVHITGEIEVDLLPMPRMRFADVVVGSPDAPSAEIASVEAEFTSVLDFLRDRYAITRLVARDPHLYLSVDADGALVAPINLPEEVKATNISIDNAEIDNGALRITDSRNGNVYSANALNGSLRISDMRGPYAAQGTAQYEGQNYQFRVSTTALNPNGRVQVSAFMRPESGAFSLAAEGNVDTGDVPHFEGDVTYRRTARPTPTSEGGVRGDLVMTANVEASPQALNIPAYTLVPDENRAGTRITGDASVELGAQPNFAVTLNGGVVALAPTEAIDADGEDVQGWALAQLLRELPVPPTPHMNGYVHADIAELELRGLSLRNVALDASLSRSGDEEAPEAWSWALEQAEARLPGDTGVMLAGIVGEDEGMLSFDGEISMTSERLDTLARGWRRMGDGNPLFGVEGALTADLRLSQNVLSMTDAELSLDDALATASAAAHLDGDRELTLTATLGSFDDAESAAFLALLPSLEGDSGFGQTFAGGAFDLRADELTLFDMDGRDLVASGNWDETGIAFNAFNGTLGGASMILQGRVTGTMSAPAIAGSGRMILRPAARNGILPFLYEHGDVAQEVRTAANRFLPANLDLELTEPNGGNSQQLRVSGRAGNADVWTRMELTGGLSGVLGAPLIATASVSADDLQSLATQLGWSEANFGTSETPANMLVRLDGSLMNSIQLDMNLWEGEAPENGVEPDAAKGNEMLTYSGSAIVSNIAQPYGRGQVTFDIVDPLPWLELFGASGLDLPPLDGAAEFSLSQDGVMSLASINAAADGINTTGELVGTPSGGTMSYSGNLRLDRLDVRALGAFAGGPASLIGADGSWPDGPFEQSDEARSSTGTVNVAADSLTSLDRVLARDATLDVVWDDSSVQFERGSAAMGGGTIRFDAEYCCSGTLAQKQLSGSIALEDVDVTALLPEAAANDLGGAVSAGLRFETTGQSYLDMVEALSGSGSFSVTDIRISHMSERVFEVVSRMDNILGLDAGQLVSAVEDALDRGSFTAAEMSGTVNLAGGILRAANVGAQNERASLFGGMTLDLASLRLDGNWTLTPVGAVDEDRLITEATSRIGAGVGGTLSSPTRRLDLGAMADAIQVRALELELDRLEALRQEQDARNREEAQRRAELMAEEARRNAEAAIQAERERQAQEAAEAEARREARESEQQERVFGPASDEGFQAPAPSLQDNSSQTIDLLGG